MSNRIPYTPRRQSQSKTDTETSSLVSSPSASEQSSASEDVSENSAQAPVIKTRQTSVAASTTPATHNTNSSAPPQAAITSSPPTVKNRMTGDQKRARYSQARNLPAYQRDTHINKIKKVKQGGTEDIKNSSERNTTWEKFSMAVTKDGKLTLGRDYKKIDVSELAPWLRTSPDSLRELVIFDYDMSHADATVLAKALLENRTLTTLCLHIGSEGALAVAEVLRGNRTLTTIDLSANHLGYDDGVNSLAEVFRDNATITKLCLDSNSIDKAGAAALGKVFRDNRTLTMLDLRKNRIGDDGTAALVEFLQVNKTLSTLNLHDNNICNAGAVALAEALRVNRTLTKVDLSWNFMGIDGAQALVDALKVNTTLIDLNIHFCPNISAAIDKEIRELLNRNRKLKLPYAEASLDLLVRHSPELHHVDVPKELLPLIADQLSNEVLKIFEDEWKEAFRASPPPITTTTTNTTTTTTTTTTTDSTIPTTLTTSPAPIVTSPALAPPVSTQPTATAPDINALLADPNPVVALSRWIDHQSSPAAALNWVDPANGYTLLHYAVIAQQGAVVRSLLARGIDRTKADNTNQTAAQLAQQLAESSSSQAVAAIAALLQ